MSSGLFDYLMEEREEELRKQHEAQMQQQLQQVLEDTLLVRFPAAPLALVRLIRRVEQTADLHRLIPNPGKSWRFARKPQGYVNVTPATPRPT